MVQVEIQRESDACQYCSTRGRAKQHENASTTKPYKYKERMESSHDTGTRNSHQSQPTKHLIADLPLEAERDPPKRQR